MAQAGTKDALVAQIREKLMQKGYTITAWARANGHNNMVVIRNLHRYAARPRLPHSPEVYAILSGLYKATGVNLMKKAE